MSFIDELTGLLNRHGRDNEANTPDYILASYLDACLSALITSTQQRETWFGRDGRPGGPAETGT
jgi:hypothetical protein